MWFTYMASRNTAAIGPNKPHKQFILWCDMGTCHGSHLTDDLRQVVQHGNRYQSTSDPRAPMTPAPHMLLLCLERTFQILRTAYKNHPSIPLLLSFILLPCPISYLSFMLRSAFLSNEKIKRFTSVLINTTLNRIIINELTQVCSNDFKIHQLWN